MVATPKKSAPARSGVPAKAGARASTSRVRIVGGTWRSRLITFQSAPGLRPTPDAVREKLFNWLGQRLDGLHCLDLFAGTGVLGFEAASRGAAAVTFVERHAGAHEQLLKNAQALNPDGVVRLEFVRGDAVEFATRAVATGRKFDLIFLDPPYHQGWLDQLAPCLDRLCAPNGHLYVEAEHPVENIGNWAAIRQGRAGQVCYQLLANTAATKEGETDEP